MENKGAGQELMEEDHGGGKDPHRAVVSAKKKEEKHEVSGDLQRHNVHFKFRENRSILSRVEREHRDGTVITIAFFISLAM
jgi:hypothetical protein